MGVSVTSTHTHTHTHTLSHAFTYAHSHSITQKHRHSPILHTHTCSPTSLLRGSSKDTHARARIHTRTHICTLTRSLNHSDITVLHTHTHTRTHAHNIHRFAYTPLEGIDDAENDNHVVPTAHQDTVRVRHTMGLPLHSRSDSNRMPLQDDSDDLAWVEEYLSTSGDGYVACVCVRECGVVWAVPETVS